MPQPLIHIHIVEWPNEKNLNQFAEAVQSSRPHLLGDVGGGGAMTEEESETVEFYSIAIE